MQESFLSYKKHRPRQGLRRRLASPWGAFALAAIMLGVSVGVLPTPASLSRLLGIGFAPSYPCAGGMCGCSSAEQCWTTCRCQPLSEKLAWARRNGVEVPAYVDLSDAALAASSEPECPLCLPEDVPVAATEAASPLPSLSALRCQGIELLMVVPVAPATARAAHDRAIAPTPARIARLVNQAAPCSRAIDTPSPPPRRALG